LFIDSKLVVSGIPFKTCLQKYLNMRNGEGHDVCWGKNPKGDPKILRKELGKADMEVCDAAGLL
jgi:hypothetical protein